MEVTGGAGGTQADLEAMSAAAGQLAAFANDLTDVVTELCRVGADVDLLVSAALDPRGWADVLARLRAAALGRSGVAAAATELAGLAVAVRAAATAYAEVDRVVAGSLSSSRDLAAGTAGQVVWRASWRYAGVVAPAVAIAVAGVVLWRTGDLVVLTVADAASDARTGDLHVDSLDERGAALAAQASVRLRHDGVAAANAALGWAARHPLASEHAVAAAPSFLAGVTGLQTVATLHAGRTGSGATGVRAPWSFPPDDVDDLAALAAVTGYASGLLGRGTVSVRAAEVAPPQPVRPPRGVADLVSRAVALAPSRDGTLPGEPGRVRVERVRSGTSSAAIAYVPATQTWDLGRTSNPMDATSNLDAMAGIRSSAQVGVVQALREAGVDQDEPLLLVGYSQGGLTSMALASDAAFATEFSPAAVLTVGSPVAGFRVPDDVPVLSLEHAEDLVTVLDGAPNPDRPSWTTVRRSVLDPQDGDAVVRAVVADRPTAAHDADAYLRTAELVDAAGHRSVRTWTEQVGVFLDRPGATSSATDWVAERQVDGATGPAGGGTP